MYAPAAENLAYLQTVAKENDFYRYIKFKHEITGASWSDDDSMWALSVKDLVSGETFEDKVNVFLEFNGPVRYHISITNVSHVGTHISRSNPRLTPIAGIKEFKGEVVHPAYWSKDTTVDNKRVALIGYGCTMSSSCTSAISVR